MADGYRITEDGSYRITEASIHRITEQFVSAEAALASTGSLSVVPMFSASGIIQASATGSISVTPTVTRIGLLALSGEGSVSLFGTITKFGLAALSSAGTLSADPGKVFYGELSLNAFGSKQVVPSLTLNGKLNGIAPAGVILVGEHTLSGRLELTGTGSFVVSAVGKPKGNLNAQAISTLGLAPRFDAKGFTSLQGQATQTVSGSLTTSGAFNKTGNGFFSPVFNFTLGGLLSVSASSSQTLTDTYTEFAGTQYVNVNGVWKTITIYAKHAGTWKTVTTGYKKINNFWKRVV